MKKSGKTKFSPKVFLAKVGNGKTVAKYRKNQVVFSQGDAADAVFYIQTGKIKLTVISEKGKEAVIGILESTHFFGEGSSEWPPAAGHNGYVSRSISDYAHPQSGDDCNPA